jgi:GH43 family beta-xylosidase
VDEVARPVLDTDEKAGQWGPGHNCFTTTPDRKTDILVYHARNYKYDGNDPLNTGDRAPAPRSSAGGPTARPTSARPSPTVLTIPDREHRCRF